MGGIEISVGEALWLEFVFRVIRVSGWRAFLMGVIDDIAVLSLISRYRPERSLC